MRKGSWKSYFIMHFGTNFRLNMVYYPGDKVRTLLLMIDLRLDNLPLSLNATAKEFINVFYFSS
jgi:hypothetical protein